eukprot:CAMPEP_0194107756 /NCGR_PEP_ID=MMETSP0150-20130528/7560_1 /TAXON_ID=122233 /ORGANISM="Chaetoceros debilis, Strain MM31A-1" /LENGTH=760 /DNA_ID=CAMNT_0038796251 /DNA_START=65 /DNA_END=2347 /DNA_ORIENTATION=+
MTVQLISIQPPPIKGSTVRSNPLNPLAKDVRCHLQDAIQSAISDPAITSIILHGGKNFSAGADITEFSGSENLTTSKHVPSLQVVIDLIESSPKPIVAAVTGVALGGGCELALACHFRVAHSKAKMGLPEVKIGVIPGGDGTQRLPRLSKDVAWTLDVIMSGRMFGMAEAKSKKIVDGITDNFKDVLEVAQKWADYATIMKDMTFRMASNQEVFAEDDAAALASARAICEQSLRKIPPKDRGGEALHAVVKAVRASFESKTFKEGSDLETEIFFDLLLNSHQGRGLRHAFFAERKVDKGSKKLLGGPIAQAFLNPKAGPLVGVIGAGTMGSGIAISFLRSGCKVIIVDNSEKSLERGSNLISKILQSDVTKKRMSSSQAAHILKNNFSTTSDMKTGEFCNCLVVVEAVFENLKIKQSIFRQLDTVIRNPKALLLSNTSTLNIDSIASALSPQKRNFCAGMHFFSPAHVMKLVEIVISSDTSPETVAIVQMITSKKLRKVGVTVGNCEGFVGNRMVNSYSAEAAFVLTEGGGSVQDVDKALVNFGMAIGPLNMGDLAGTDIGYLIAKEKGLVRDPKTGSPGPNRKEGMRYSDLLDDLVVKLGRSGQKVMKGWYDYDPKVGRGRKPLPSKEVEDFIASYTNGDAPTTKYSKQEIVERLLFPLVNEGFKILEENIAQKPSDIDVIYVYGYGWPAYRGGPMYWIDNEVGLPYFLKRLNEMNHSFPGSTYYIPSALLKECVALGFGLQEYYDKGFHKKHTNNAKL